MTLEQAIQGLRRDLRQYTRSLQDRTSRSWGRSLRGIPDASIGFSNPFSNLKQAIDKASKLQERAVAMGTTLTKFQKENSAALGKLTGSQKELIEALMDFRQVGLRNTGDQLNKLAVRMRYTGQSTGALVDMMSNFSVYFGDNIAAMDNLAKQNMDLARSYEVTNESLIRALTALDGTIKEQAYLTGSDMAAQAIQRITALSGGRLTGPLTNVVNQLMDPSNMRLRALTGNQGIAGSVAGAQSADQAAQMLLDAISRIGATGRKFSVGGTGEGGQFATKGILESAGGFQLFMDAQNIANLNLENVKEAIDKASDEDMKTQRQQIESAKSFYETAINDYYSPMLANLDKIAIAVQIMSVTQGVGSALRNSTFLRNARRPTIIPGTPGTPEIWRPFQPPIPAVPGTPAQVIGAGAMGRAAGLLLRVGTFLTGPWGLALTTAISLAPVAINYFSNRSKKDDEALKAQQEIEKHTKAIAEKDRVIKARTIDDFIAEQLRGHANRVNQAADEARARQEMNNLLANIHKSMQSSASRLNTIANKISNP